MRQGPGPLYALRRAVVSSHCWRGAAGYMAYEEVPEQLQPMSNEQPIPAWAGYTGTFHHGRTQGGIMLKRALKRVGMALWKFFTESPPADEAQRENTRRVMAKLRGEVKSETKAVTNSIRREIEKDWDKP